MAKTCDGVLRWCLVGALVGLSALAPMGCDSKSGQPGGGPAGDKPVDPSSPAGLGEAAGKIYADAMDALVKALASKPEPADAKAKTIAITESAQKKLVELGKKREAMKPEERSAFDRGVSSTLRSLSADTFKKYSDLVSHYNQADREVGALLSEANILTQYANFDLLKKQNPKEAEKHGIK